MTKLIEAKDLKDGQKVRAYMILTGGRLGTPTEATVQYGTETRVRLYGNRTAVSLSNGEICHPKQYKFEVIA